MFLGTRMSGHWMFSPVLCTATCSGRCGLRGSQRAWPSGAVGILSGIRVTPSVYSPENVKRQIKYYAHHLYSFFYSWEYFKFSAIKLKKKWRNINQQGYLIYSFVPIKLWFTFDKSLLSFYYTPNTELALSASGLDLLPLGSGWDLWDEPWAFTLWSGDSHIRPEWRATALKGWWGKAYMGGLGSWLSPLISMWCWEPHLCLWFSGWISFWKMREWNLIVPEVLFIAPQPLGLNQKNKSLSIPTFCDCTS